MHEEDCPPGPFAGHVPDFGVSACSGYCYAQFQPKFSDGTFCGTPTKNQFPADLQVVETMARAQGVELPI
jgi:hypothetical protein